MRVFIEEENKLLVFEKGMKCKELLALIGINDGQVLLVRNGKAVLADEELSVDDDVRVLPVISGG